MKVMLRAIASHRVGDRFGRVEPHINAGRGRNAISRNRDAKREKRLMRAA